MTEEEVAATDDASAQRYYAMLSELNGYPEVFSVFVGEPVRIRLARKPSLARQARFKMQNLHTLFKSLTVESVELRNAATGAAVAAAVPRGVKISHEKPRNYRDEGAGYGACIEIATDALEPGLYECTVRDSFGVASRHIYFNVKPRAHAGYDLICVLPTFTWQAYNRLGGGSFYSTSLGPVRTVSIQRPNGVKGDNSISAAIPFLSAFAEAGARVACVDSWDLHHGLLPGGAVPVMALLTHDEYWSAQMRRTVDRYVRDGGMLMVMAGNVCWWKIEVDGTNITVDTKQRDFGKQEPGGRLGNQWHQQGDPEERTFVSSFRFGGYTAEQVPHMANLRELTKNLDPSVFDDWRSLKVRRPNHPLFRGVALDPGDRFGNEVPIVYREVDAVPLTPDGKVDRMWYDADEVEPKIIATGTVVRGRLFHHPVAQAGIVVEADIGDGHVLHMGTFGWSRGLSQKNERVKQVVQNAYRHCRELARKRQAAP